MSYTKRKFIKSAIVMPAALGYSQSVLPCGAGGDATPNFVPLPLNTFSYVGSGDGTEIFLNKTYGKEYWRYSNDPLVFIVPDIVESPYSIPIRIKLCSNELPISGGSSCPRQFYNVLTLYIQRFVLVQGAVSAREPGGLTSRSSVISWVATFNLGECVLLDIATRIQVFDSGAFKLIAVVSQKGSRSFSVIKQNAHISIATCSSQITGYFQL